jgi:hypothetical protein
MHFMECDRQSNAPGDEEDNHSTGKGISHEEGGLEVLDVLEQKNVRTQGAQHHNILLEQQIPCVAGLGIAVNLDLRVAQATDLATTNTAEPLARRTANQY